MTKADVFYFVIAHLRAQGVQAKNEMGSCRYRTPEGLKCAAGCLIHDLEYTPEFEGSCWAKIDSNFPQYKEYRDMITDLQLLHDGAYNGFDTPRFALAVRRLEEQHLTYEERWHDYFCRLPVRIGKNDCRGLETIERRYGDWYHDRGFYPEYREIK